MLQGLTLGVCLLLAGGSVYAEGDAEIRALGEQLLDPDLEVACKAAHELEALGERAAPALEQLVKALDRQLPEGVAQQHYHPWMGMLPAYRRGVVATLEAIGPSAKAAVPGLVRMLERRPGGARDWLIRPLFTYWREDEVARSALKTWATNPRLRVDGELANQIKSWLASLGPEAHDVWDAWLTDGIGDSGFAMHTLYEAGAPGRAILRKHFETSPHHAKAMLDMWIDAGELPTFARTEAITRLGRDVLGSRTAALAELLAGTEPDTAHEVAAALGDSPMYWDSWRQISTRADDWSRRVGRDWFEAQRPKASLTGFEAAGLRRTTAYGGPGGTSFEEPPGGLLVGLRYTRGTVQWRPAIRSIQGVYLKEGALRDGPRHGQPGAQGGVVMAQPGYAIGGLCVQHGVRFESFAVVFMRVTSDDSLDPTDAYIDTWHGGWLAGHATPLLGGEGHAIVALHGRAGADVDALGLVELHRPPLSGQTEASK